MAKSVNTPHKPSCAYLCSGEERRACDCGAVVWPTWCPGCGRESGPMHVCGGKGGLSS